MASIARFLRAYLRPDRVRVVATETTVDRGGDVHAATLFRPPGPKRLPGWLVLHGLTHRGRHHPSLLRFVRAVAASGNAVLVPDIPEWRELTVAPAVTVATIRAAVRSLHDRQDVLPDRIGLFGFSFGATQALIAAAEPGVRELLHGIAAWGGYCDLHRLFVFAMTGEHELDGTQYQTPPDPYGVWIMVGNYFTNVPGHENDGDVAAAALALAREAGKRGTPSWDPVYDAAKLRLRATLPAEKHALFDLIAPLSTDTSRDREHARSKALDLADAVLRVDPLMDPQPFLRNLGVRTLFAHGRDDRLIPFTETIRLSRAVPAESLVNCTITSLFAHSGGTDRGLGPFGLITESTRFVRVLRRILRLI